MEDPQIIELDTRVEFQWIGDDMVKFTVSASGAEIVFTYVAEKADAATALVCALPDILADAVEASERGEVEELEPKDPFKGLETL